MHLIRPRFQRRTRSVYKPCLSGLVGVTIILLLHTWFGLSYVVTIPTWESYDEPGHFGYAAQLASTGTFPSPEDPMPNPERIQPPLYYLLLSGFFAVSNTDVNAYYFPRTNPYFHYGTSGYNYALHPTVLTPDQQRIERAVTVSRIVTLLLSLLGVAFVYLAARLLWPRQIGLVLAATALYAFWPQLLFNSSVVTNDGPAAIFGALLTWLLLKFHQARVGHGYSVRWVLLCAVVIAVGAAVKLNLLVLIGPVFVAAFLTLSPRIIAGALIGGSVAAGLAILILQSLPAVLLPFLGQSAEGDSALSTLIRRVGENDTLPFLGNALRYALDSSFGLFGWGNLPLPQWIQGVWMIGAALAGLGLVVWLVTNRGREPIKPRLVLLSMIGIMILGALALVLFYKSIHLIPGRYLLPILPAFCLLSVTGLQVLPLRLQRLAWGVVGALIVLGVLIPWGLIASAYALPPVVDEATIPNPQKVELLPDIVFLGSDVPPSIAYPEDVIPVDIYWKAAEPIRFNYTVQVELVGPDGQGYGLLDTFPGDGNYPTSSWAVNRPFKDRYRLYVRGDFPAPALARFKVSLTPDPTFKKSVIFGQIAIHSREPLQPSIPENAAALFGERVKLRDMRLTLADRTLTVNLIWQALGTMNDGTVFIHIEQPNDGSQPVAQQDHPPRNGTFPFSQWLKDETVADEYKLALPTNLAAGRYPIRAGVYDSVNLYRWPIAYPGAKDDQLLLGWLTVDASGGLSVEATYPAAK